jgi:hypothetical protein
MNYIYILYFLNINNYIKIYKQIKIKDPFVILQFIIIYFIKIDIILKFFKNN